MGFLPGVENTGGISPNVRVESAVGQTPLLLHRHTHFHGVQVVVVEDVNQFAFLRLSERPVLAVPTEPAGISLLDRLPQMLHLWISRPHQVSDLAFPVEGFHKPATQLRLVEHRQIFPDGLRPQSGNQIGLFASDLETDTHLLSGGNQSTYRLDVRRGASGFDRSAAHLRQRFVTQRRSPHSRLCHVWGAAQRSGVPVDQIQQGSQRIVRTASDEYHRRLRVHDAFRTQHNVIPPMAVFGRPTDHRQVNLLACFPGSPHRLLRRLKVDPAVTGTGCAVLQRTRNTRSDRLRIVVHHAVALLTGPHSLLKPMIERTLSALTRSRHRRVHKPAIQPCPDPLGMTQLVDPHSCYSPARQLVQRLIQTQRTPDAASTRYRHPQPEVIPQMLQRFTARRRLGMTLSDPLGGVRQHLPRLRLRTRRQRRCRQLACNRLRRLVRQRTRPERHIGDRIEGDISDEADDPPRPVMLLKETSRVVLVHKVRPPVQAFRLLPCGLLPLACRLEQVLPRADRDPGHESADSRRRYAKTGVLRLYVL